MPKLAVTNYTPDWFPIHLVRIATTGQCGSPVFPEIKGIPRNDFDSPVFPGFKDFKDAFDSPESKAIVTTCVRKSYVHRYLL